MSSPPVCSGIRVTRSLVLCVWILGRCLSFCPFWPLCCLSFDLRILITPLVSSNYFHYIFIYLYVPTNVRRLINSDSPSNVNIGGLSVQYIQDQISLSSTKLDYIWVTLLVSYKKQELLIFREHLDSPTGFGEVHVVHLFSFQCWFFCLLLLACLRCVLCLIFPMSPDCLFLVVP